MVSKTHFTTLPSQKSLDVQMFQALSSQHPFNEEQKIRWLQLSMSKGVGPVTFWNFLKKTHGNIEQACAYVKNLASRARAENELQRHERQGVQMIFANDPAFPQALLQLRDCPPFLSFIGDPALLNQTSIAIVGARNASLHGKILASRIAKNLGENGIITISGMARGIDRAAHEGSLETGSIAVLAGGVDVFYPPENEDLYQQLRERGGVLSEMPMGTTIEPSLFPRRNRLIAGLAQGVVLIEAAAHSGTLITAQYAMNSQKRVFAVPGFPTDPRSFGGNQLLRQGAIVTESAQDIFRTLGIQPKVFPKKSDNQGIKSGKTKKQDAMDPQQGETGLEGDIHLKTAILIEIGTLPVSVESLFQNLNCSLPHLLNLLTELENEGKIFRNENNDVLLKSTC